MCSCNKNRQKFVVTLKGGIKLTRPTEAAATALAAKHPGATITKG